MEEFEMTPFAFVRNICSISGIWPLVHPFRRRIRAFIISIILFLTYLVQILNFITNDFNTRSSTFYITYLFSTTSICIIYYGSLYEKKLLLQILLQIMNDWRNIKKTKQFDVLLDYAFLSRKCILMFIFTYNSYMTSMLLFSFKPILLDLIIPLNETRPHSLLFPMHWYNREETNFSNILFCEYFAAIILGLSVIGGVSMYLIIVQHVCAMFRIIGCLLDNIMIGNEEELKVINDKVIYSRMIHIIQIHTRTIEYIQTLNSKCNIPILGIMICSICFIGIGIGPIMEILNDNVNMSNIGLLTFMILFVISHLVWMFVFCTLGQHLHNVSAAIFYKGYEVPWYLLSKKTQKLLFFIIARADKPNSISIGKMFEATHEFFTALVRLSISYGMVLHSVR